MGDLSVPMSGRHVREEVERRMGGRFSDFDRAVVDSVLDDIITKATVERVAVALNDNWAAGSHGGRWHELDEVERENWRDTARTGLAAAFGMTCEEGSNHAS